MIEAPSKTIELVGGPLDGTRYPVPSWAHVITQIFGPRLHTWFDADDRAEDGTPLFRHVRIERLPR
jgi:hypothetical protein